MPREINPDTPLVSGFPKKDTPRALVRVALLYSLFLAQELKKKQQQQQKTRATQMAGKLVCRVTL